MVCALWPAGARRHVHDLVPVEVPGEGADAHQETSAAKGDAMSKPESETDPWREQRSTRARTQGRCGSLWVTEPLAEKFNRFTRRTDGCWLWVGTRDNWGYGLVRYEGRSTFKAHRASWLLHRGPLTPGMWVLHSCDNPACVNPEHLRLGNHQQNIDDMVSRRRHAHGTRGAKAKVTDADVLAIRASTESAKALAARYSVSPAAIYSILRRKSWKHL